MKARWINWMGSALLVSALAACGGGGGDDGGSGGGQPARATGDLTRDNVGAKADSMAKTVVNSANTRIDSLVSSLSAATPDALPDLSSPADIARWALVMALRAPGREQAQATTRNTVPCPSGSLSFVIEHSGTQLRAGDSVSLTANSCSMQGDVVNGTVRIRITGASGSGGVENVQMEMSFGNFGASDMRMNGDVSVSARLSSNGDMVLSMAFKSLAVNDGITSVVWGHSIEVSVDGDTGEASVRFGGYMNVGNERFGLSQPLPFVFGRGGLPRPGGLLRAVDASGDSVELVAESSRFAYRFFSAVNSSGVPDLVLPGLPF